MVEYSWKPKTSVPVDAQAAGERLEEIRVRHNGRLTPTAVVDDARPQDAVLHPAFEWNDKVAAERFREDQARYMLRSIVIVRPAAPEQEPTRPIRAFVSVTRDEDRSYTSIDHAMSDAELREQVVERAWRELLEWKARYQEYRELAEVCAAIDAESDRRAA